MMRVSASLFGGVAVPLEHDARQTEVSFLAGRTICAEVRTSRTSLRDCKLTGAATRSGSEAVAQEGSFQLESLILAQNERWRQA